VSARGNAPGLAVFVVLAGLVAALAAGCTVDEAKFQSRVFHCDTSAPDPLCGTDVDGQPMTCFAARQIGGADFCTPRCDEPMSLPESDAVCVQGNARLAACNPTDDPPGSAPGAACGRPELGCLRTDVLTDEGVCVTMQPCTQDTDCHDPVRSTCAATFLTELYAGNEDLHADHLYCLQRGCDATATSCSPGESCLRKVIPATANPPDICVPNCDSQLRCPPNHFCFRKLSGPDSPAVCIPGLLGFECESDVDCLVGQCLAMEGGPINPKLCSIACNTDADCSTFDSNQGLFFCNASHQCVSPSSFRGTSCRTTDDCTRNAAQGAVCVRFGATDAEGSCLLPCDENGNCSAFSGVEQTCLPLHDQNAASGKTPVCFPGFFGIPCTAEGSCVGGVGDQLTCRGLDGAFGTPSAPGFCTAICANDADCAGNRWLEGNAFCAGSVCVPKQADGKACARNTQCATGVCTIAAGASAGTCGGTSP
jgi:hypothetical protein